MPRMLLISTPEVEQTPTRTREEGIILVEIGEEGIPVETGEALETEADLRKTGRGSVRQKCRKV